MRTIKIAIILFSLAGFSANALALPNDFYTVVAPSEVQFQVIDPLGNITGYNPNTKTVLNNIPNTEYIEDVATTGAEEPTKDEIFHKIHPTLIMDNVFIATGKYKIKLFGSSVLETVRLDFRSFYQGYKGVQLIGQLNSIIYPNVTWTYEITIPDVPPPTKNIPLIKVSTPQELITDIKTAGQLDYIGDVQYSENLTDRIAQVSLLKGDQKKRYEDILFELTSLYNKPEQDRFIKKEGYDVLKEDLEYIIRHIL